VKRQNTVTTAQSTRAQPTHIKHLPATRLTSAQAPIRTPTPQDNSTESAPWKTSTPAALSAHKTGFRRSHTLKFRAEGPTRKMAASSPLRRSTRWSSSPPDSNTTL